MYLYIEEGNDLLQSNKEPTEEELGNCEAGYIKIVRWNTAGYFEEAYVEVKDSDNEDEGEEGKVEYETTWSRV